ncbi:hypothetical protein C806_00338 [Lachnospiraceae bacterium 3-1]|nr:hypothetical protein C806_00338 [Lachnospiraceae bacterium 3-1]
MHNYLRSIGFGNLRNKNEVNLLIKDIIEHPDKKIITEDDYGNVFAELSKEFGEYIGISVRGFYIRDNEFHMEYYYPYFLGSGVTTEEKVEVEKRFDRESYAGVCDEMRIGVTLIFYLQNVIEYLQEFRTKNGKRMPVNTTISALATDGKIILPVYKNENQIKSGEKYTNNRNHLMAAARDGDEEAMESLTLEDIDTYSMISRRIMTEDILSIVDTYFMPSGIESDQYNIMGEILDFYTIDNKRTKEKLYVLTLNSNHLIFDVCINQEDLLGEPVIGRRFKGVIWMQGRIHYQM